MLTHRTEVRRHALAAYLRIEHELDGVHGDRGEAAGPHAPFNTLVAGRHSADNGPGAMNERLRVQPGQGSAREGGAMEQRLEFVCPDCGEEFSLGAAFAIDPNRLLLCPCCGSTDIVLESDQRVLAVAHADAR